MEEHEGEVSEPAVVQNCFTQAIKVVKSRAGDGSTNFIGSIHVPTVARENVEAPSV
jgi:hypothetical protein